MSDSTTPASPSPEPAVTAPAAEADAEPATPSPADAQTTEPAGPGATVRRVSGDGVTTATGPAERAEGAGRHSRLVFRVSPIAWLLVLFLLFTVTPVAAGPLRPLLVLYVVPIALGWWIARTRTVAEPTGLVARTMFGQTRIEWADLRGLKLDGRRVHAALAGDRLVKLPEVRPRHLGLISDISGGRIPDPTKISTPVRESQESTEDGTAAAPAASGAAEDTPDGGSATESSE